MVDSPFELPSPEAARQHPALWAIYASEGTWQPYRHLLWLCDQIDDFLKGKERFLAISMPPGHGKSEFLSKFLPTFLLGTTPGYRVIQASYAASLTVEWSRISKELLAAHGHEVFGVEVNPRAASESWDVFRFDENGRARRSGYLRAAGRGGPITGKRAELLIIDDILKDDEEAQSPRTREKVWRWFAKVALSRLTKAGKAIVVMTRWHHDDLIGRLEERQRRGQDKDGWRIIRLPAIAEDDDPMGRAPGEALCPELFPLAELERIRSRDAHTWSALYQGRPTPQDGAVYKREMFRYCDLLPETITAGGRTVLRRDLIWFATADLAVSERDRADQSAIAVCAADLDAGVLFILDVMRGRWDAPTILGKMRAVVDPGGWRCRSVCVERTAFHLQLCQLALQDGIPVLYLEPDRDKVARAQPAVAMFTGAKVFFAKGAGWTTEAEAELLQFPSGRDDVPDAIAYAVRVILDLLRAYRGGEDPGPQPDHVVLRN